MQGFGGKCCHFLGRYRKNWESLGKQTPEESKIFGVFWFFRDPLQENARFWWKMLPCPEEVPKNHTQKKKMVESGGSRTEESKIFGVLGFCLYHSRKMQGFGGKCCHFLGEYQKLKIKVEIVDIEAHLHI